MVDTTINNNLCKLRHRSGLFVLYLVYDRILVSSTYKKIVDTDKSTWY